MTSIRSEGCSTWTWLRSTVIIIFNKETIYDAFRQYTGVEKRYFASFTNTFADSNRLTYVSGATYISKYSFLQPTLAVCKCILKGYDEKYLFSTPVYFQDNCSHQIFWDVLNVNKSIFFKNFDKIRKTPIWGHLMFK